LGWRKKVYPVAGPLRGHSLESTGPWTPLYIYYHGTPFDNENTILSTPRVLEFPTPRVLDFPPPSPTQHQGALIVTRDTSAVTISPGKGSGDPTNASGSGMANSRLSGGQSHVFPSTSLISYFFLVDFLES